MKAVTIRLPRPRSRASTRPSGRQHGVAVALVAAAVVLALVVVGLVVLPSDGSSQPSRREVDDRLTVALAAAFVAGVVTADRDSRARTIGEFVIPQRVPEFVEVLDDTVGPMAQRGRRVAAVPRAAKVAEASGDVRVVLVLAQVTTQKDGPVDRQDGDWQVWGVGLARFGTGWRVFSYEGMREGVEPGDPRLDGFVELTAREVG